MWINDTTKMPDYLKKRIIKDGKKESERRKQENRTIIISSSTTRNPMKKLGCIIPLFKEVKPNQ